MTYRIRTFHWALAWLGISLFFGTIAYSAERTTVEPVSVTVGALDTEDGQTALHFAFKRLVNNKLESAKTWSENEASKLSASCGPNSKSQKECVLGESIWMRRFTSGGNNLTPQADIKGGAEDSFDGVVLKLAGHYLRTESVKIFAQDEDDKPILTEWTVGLDLDKPFWVFPFAFGMETTRQLDFASGIVEVGARPYIMRDLPFQIGRDVRVGGFIQAGYKFKIDDDPNAANSREGGAKDESEEDTDDVLARIKLDAEFDFDFGGKDLKITGFVGVPMKLIGKAKLWYDIVNSEVYHSVGATLRLKLDDKSDTHFDITYENGAGAPTFNEGSQFGARLTVKY